MKRQRIIEGVRCCVIGGAGFLGSQVVDHLIDDRGCDVVVVDNLVSGKRKHIHPKAEFYEYNILGGDLDQIFDGRFSQVMVRPPRKPPVQYIFNYAAYPYIPQCYDDPMAFMNVNCIGVLNMLDACLVGTFSGGKSHYTPNPNILGILQVSSAEIYGEAKGAVKEDEPVVPHSTYGVSKQAADSLVQVRWKEKQIPALAMRQFNCVGPRETHEYVIPEIISQLHLGPVVKLGNNSVRDFQYSGDAARMAVELLEYGKFGEVYNMGSQDCIRIYDLARMIGRLMGYSSIDIVEDESRKRPWEIWHLQSDNTKLYETIPGRPQVRLEEALTRTINYFRDNGNKWDW